MVRISLVCFLLFSFSCIAQSDTTKRKTIDLRNGNMISDVDYFGKYSKQVYYDLAESLSHDIDTFWRYDVRVRRYVTNAHFLELLRSKYSQLILNMDAVDLDVYFTKSINPNKRDLLDKAVDSAVGYILYPLICDNCVQKSKNKCSYIVYYNNKGKILRYGSAYLKKGKISTFK